MLLKGIFYCYFYMSFNKILSFLLFLPVFTAFFSCAARIEGVVNEGGAAELSLKTSLEPRTTALIGSLQGFLGDARDAPILDGPAISRSMAASPGVRAVNLKNSGSAALDGTISISNIGDFLAKSGSKTKFIDYTQGQTAGSSGIVITLDKDSAPVLISMLSSEVEDYLSALMAPAVLGDTITTREYLDMVASVYGRALASEIAAARIKAFIDFPRPIKSILGGTYSGNRAEFEVPLVDILVLEQPLRYELSW